jgi:REP element-mobilizing transposase RayT
MERYKNKYRIASARASWWDYGSNASYFITICTEDRIHYFGEIENQKMNLSDLGKIAETCWYDIPHHFPFVELGAFQVMPNHLHGIIIINKPDVAPPHMGTGNVETRLIASLHFPSETLPKIGGFAGNKNPMLHENLPRVLRWYKGRTSFEIHKIHFDFKWQPRYHDHIIRNNAEYQRINDYIENNPANWAQDKFFK